MGPIHICRDILSFCVIVSVFGALSAEESNLEDCANVREHFKMFGNENLVPVKPISGKWSVINFYNKSESSCPVNHYVCLSLYSFRLSNGGRRFFSRYRQFIPL